MYKQNPTPMYIFETDSGDVITNQTGAYDYRSSCVLFQVHLVHYNTAYSDLDEAADKPDGLAVLGIMFRVSAC